MACVLKVEANVVNNSNVLIKSIGLIRERGTMVISEMEPV